MTTTRLPRWLKTNLSFDEQYRHTLAVIRRFDLHTVCQGAGCPNRAACFGEGTATFMILGDVCTRHCRFCGVPGDRTPGAPDDGEPARVAAAVAELGLDYAVITSVTRDDLPDGGAAFFAATIHAVRSSSPQTHIEVLTPDFNDSGAALQMIAAAKPDVFNHNVETAPRLYAAVRPEADYRRSLHVLQQMKERLPAAHIKSGMMVGLGEEHEEIRQVLRDLKQAGCDLVTIGQYLAPSTEHIPVARFVPPEEFIVFETMASNIGFSGVASGPLVRSSYHAKRMFENI